MLDQPVLRRRGGNLRTEGVHRDHGEKEALRIMHEGSRNLGLPLSMADLAALTKSDERKVLLAILLRTHTSVSNQWIAEKLAMGHPDSVSRTFSASRTDKSMAKSIKKLETLLICEH